MGMSVAPATDVVTSPRFGILRRPKRRCLMLLAGRAGLLCGTGDEAYGLHAAATSRVEKTSNKPRTVDRVPPEGAELMVLEEPHGHRSFRDEPELVDGDKGFLGLGSQLLPETFGQGPSRQIRRRGFYSNLRNHDSTACSSCLFVFAYHFICPGELSSDIEIMRAGVGTGLEAMLTI